VQRRRGLTEKKALGNKKGLKLRALIKILCPKAGKGLLQNQTNSGLQTTTKREIRGIGPVVVF